MYKVVVEGKGSIVARVVADSINKNGNRITTFELEYHRFIHSELMTHRLFSRNAMSSRAVPVSKMIEQVRNNPATPIHWGKNQAGMQADNVLMGESLENAKRQWKQSAIYAASQAEIMSSIGSHKQIVNRLLEPFQMMKTVLTATEFDNFFWLRCDPDAQPEIQELANCMFDAMKRSEPEYLKEGQWHTPYVDHWEGVEEHSEDFGYMIYEDGKPKIINEEEAKAISASCCAQVSYRTLNNTYEKAMDIYSKLASGRKVHASPFENVAKVMKYTNISQLEPNEVWEKGVTHVDKNGDLWSGNIKGFIQLRQTMEGTVCWNYGDQ